MAIKHPLYYSVFGAVFIGASLACLMLFPSSAFAGQAPQTVVSLSPQVRSVPHYQVDAPIPVDTIRAFLREHRVIEQGEALQELAYVIGGEHQRLMSGAGDTIYVRGELPPKERVGIYRQGEPYMASDGSPLGRELMAIGEARQLSSEGDIARVEILSAHQEVRSNDVLLPLESQTVEKDFQPRLPLNHVAGQVIAVPGGVRFIGRLQMVALDVGTQNGLQPGHVLRVNRQGGQVNDPRTQALLQLPAEEVGMIMVVKPYSHMSYALVMQTSNALAVGDKVRSPSD